MGWQVGRKLTEEHKQAVSTGLARRRALGGRVGNPKGSNGGGGWPKGRSRSSETRKKISETQKTSFALGVRTGRKGTKNKNPYPLSEERRRVLQVQISRARVTQYRLSGPNRLERAVLAILIDAFPDAGWQFNLGTIIAGKVPDFLRSDGLKVAVDVHGDYWHQGENVRIRKNLFKKEGYELVVIWGSEFKAKPGLLVSRVRRAEKKTALAQKEDV